MPYIEEKSREKFKENIDGIIADLTKDSSINVGEFNFVISSIVWSVFRKNPSYTLGNNLVGVLECVKQEFYRRQLAPYEDDKIKSNGDI